MASRRCVSTRESRPSPSVRPVPRELPRIVWRQHPVRKPLGTERLAQDKRPSLPGRMASCRRVSTRGSRAGRPSPSVRPVPRQLPRIDWRHRPVRKPLGTERLAPDMCSTFPELTASSRRGPMRGSWAGRPSPSVRSVLREQPRIVWREHPVRKPLGTGRLPANKSPSLPGTT